MAWTRRLLPRSDCLVRCAPAAFRRSNTLVLARRVMILPTRSSRPCKSCQLVSAGLDQEHHDYKSARHAPWRSARPSDPAYPKAWQPWQYVSPAPADGKTATALPLPHDVARACVSAAPAPTAAPAQRDVRDPRRRRQRRAAQHRAANHPRWSAAQRSATQRSTRRPGTAPWRGGNRFRHAKRRPAADRMRLAAPRARRADVDDEARPLARWRSPALAGALLQQHGLPHPFSLVCFSLICTLRWPLPRPTSYAPFRPLTRADPH